MADYTLVKYCRLCKKRFLIRKGEYNKNYCEDCQARMSKGQGE